MSVRLLADVHIDIAIVRALRSRSVEVETAQEQRVAELDDESLLQHAMDANFVLFTQDEDFLRIATEWQSGGRGFAGVVYCRPLSTNTGGFVQDLELVAKCFEPEDIFNRVEYLPFTA